MSDLGAYLATQAQNTLDAHAAELRAPRGPLQSPVRPPKCDPVPANAEEALKKIAQNTGCSLSALELLSLLGSGIADALSTNFCPKGALPFNQCPTAVVTLNPPSGGGTYTQVATQQLDEGYEGMLQRIGTEVFPFTAGPDVAWQLRIDNYRVPKVDNQFYLFTTTTAPLPLPMSLRPGVTVSLYAINNGSTALYVNGMLGGWTQSVKRY